MKMLQIVMFSMVGLSSCTSRETPLAHDTTAADRAMLAEICPAYYHKGKGSPAEYITNTLSEGIPKRAIYLLMPEHFEKEFITFPYSREGARVVMARFKEDAERGFKWKHENLTMPIPEVTIPPIIDGIPDTKEWERAAILKGEISLDTDTAERKGDSVWRLMYDHEYLYLSGVIHDPDIQTESHYLYQGDSVEFFLLSEVRLGTYWEVIVNPDGEFFTAWHMSNPHGGFISRQEVRPDNMKVSARRALGQYSVELAFPFAALPSLTKPLPFRGARIDFMIVRTNKDRENYSKSAPVPLLYDGHNTVGYIRGILQ